jgi:hypothetical protein
VTEPKTARELIEAAKPKPGGYSTDPDDIPPHYWPSQELAKRARLAFEPMLEALEHMHAHALCCKTLSQANECRVRRALDIANGKEPR